MHICILAIAYFRQFWYNGGMAHHDVILLISPVLPGRLHGIAKFAREHGWYLTVDNRSLPPFGWHGDGALVMLDPRNTSLVKWIRRLRRRGTPIVDLTIAAPATRIPRVCGDNDAIGRLAARHFAEHGFHHTAWFSSKWTNVHSERCAAFFSATHGCNPMKFIFRKTNSRGERNWSSLRRWIAEQLAAAPKPLGVFAYSDQDATHVLNACREAGISVPEEVAILGVDDNVILCESQFVTLSSIRQDYERIGYDGSALLESLMSGGKAPKTAIRIPPTGITIRKSTDVTAAANPTIRRANEIIRRNISDRFGVEQLAAELNVSRTTLSRIFKRELGCSAGKEIMRQRLAMAKSMLSENAFSVEATAMRCGFCSGPHLANVFKRSFGVSPRKWRSMAASPTAPR